MTNKLSKQGVFPKKSQKKKQQKEPLVPSISNLDYMTKVKHFTLEEIIEDDCSLIAIHSSCEGYHLAFLLNAYCQCSFIQSKKRKGTKKIDYPFERFEWIDQSKGIEIRMISNKHQTLQNEIRKESSLFDLPETKKLYLFEDLKDVDYIIKINTGIEVQDLVRKLESIDQISYRYLIDPSQLNSDLILSID